MRRSKLYASLLVIGLVFLFTSTATYIAPNLSSATFSDATNYARVKRDDLITRSEASVFSWPFQNASVQRPEPSTDAKQALSKWAAERNESIVDLSETPFIVLDDGSVLFSTYTIEPPLRVSRQNNRMDTVFRTANHIYRYVPTRKVVDQVYGEETHSSPQQEHRPDSFSLLYKLVGLEGSKLILWRRPISLDLSECDSSRYIWMAASSSLEYLELGFPDPSPSPYVPPQNLIDEDIARYHDCIVSKRDGF